MTPATGLESRSAALKNWYSKATAAFRSRWNGADNRGPINVGSFDDLGPPLQVHVIWTEDPEFQFIVHTKLPDLPDRAISIRGPVPIWEVFEQVEALLAEDEWTNPFDPSVATGATGERLTTFREAMESWLLNELSNIQVGLYSRRVGGMVTTRVQVGPRCWLATVTGNIGRNDPAEYGAHAARAASSAPVEQVQPDVAAFLAEARAGEVPEAKRTTVRSSVTYFSPPIYVGPLPKPKTFKERFHRQYIPIFPDRVVDVSTGRGRMVIHKNGYVLVVGNEPIDSLGFINTLFAVARLNGLGSRAVPLIEVAGAEFDPKADKLTSWWTIWNSPRWTSPISHFWRPQSPTQVPMALEVSDETVRKVADTTAMLMGDEETCRDLLFWLQAATDLESSEYEPSFALSWIVLERWVSRLWAGYLEESDATGDRRKALLNWDAHHQLETLAMAGKVDAQRYALFMDLKSKRNRLFHRGERVEKETATSALGLAEDAVRVGVQRNGAPNENRER